MVLSFHRNKIQKIGTQKIRVKSPIIPSVKILRMILIECKFYFIFYAFII
jgi:hypothetical protein